MGDQISASLPQERSVDKQVSFDYLLFGGGLRECIGKEFACLEMWLFASKLLQDYYRGLYRIKTWN